ncbi:MAG: isoprenylcysteine carboxylmethyltransferase family protein [Candidatus Acidiferrales bacterium]
MNEAIAVQPRKFWMRWRVRIGYPIAVLYWLLATPTHHWIAMGAAVAGLGLLIRAIAAGHLSKDRELATTGPYARTRNPLYLGSAFLAAGFVIAGHSWWAGSLVAIYFALFYYPVMRNEERDLRARFGIIFDEYAAKVPLFLPNFFASGHGAVAGAAPERPFSWDLYRRNREYKALIGTIAALGVVWLRIWLQRRYGY